MPTQAIYSQTKLDDEPQTLEKLNEHQQQHRRDLVEKIPNQEYWR